MTTDGNGHRELADGPLYDYDPLRAGELHRDFREAGQWTARARAEYLRSIGIKVSHEPPYEIVEEGDNDGD